MKKFIAMLAALAVMCQFSLVYADDGGESGSEAPAVKTETTVSADKSGEKSEDKTETKTEDKSEDKAEDKAEVKADDRTEAKEEDKTDAAENKADSAEEKTDADSEKEKLFIKLFNDAPEEDRVYVIQVLQKLHDLREERK